MRRTPYLKAENPVGSPLVDHQMKQVRGKKKEAKSLRNCRFTWKADN